MLTNTHKKNTFRSRFKKQNSVEMEEESSEPADMTASMSLILLIPFFPSHFMFVVEMSLWRFDLLYRLAD